MKALLESLRSLGALKLGAMAAVTLVSLGLLGFVTLRGGDGPMALLYADLELREAGQVVDQLERARIPRQIEAGGTRILVPADQVARARLLLAKEGMPSGGSIGYEIFDRGDSLTASGFQQAINQTRAMEGELSRTIRMLQGVKAARVHLVLPKREPFARDRQEAQASVVLTMAGVARLDREGTQAVLNLIAAAVPGLRPQNIAIVDSRGNLLARAGQPTGVAGTVQSADEVKRASELRLARAVEEMLERTLGAGRVRAEAAMDLDFDQVRETQERYDPDGQVVRSQQSTTDNNRTTEVAASVSVQNNLPNADAGASPAGSQEQKQEETTNYEIGKTVRTLVHEQPQLRRISLAVMVDGAAARGPDGTLAYVERTPDELARIATLVRSAIGFNEQRGDRVEVVNMRFVNDGDGQESAVPSGWAHFEKSEILRLAETVFLAVGGLLTLLFVLRPMVLRLTMQPPSAPIALALATEPTALDAPKEEELVQLANVVGAMRMASIRRVSELVDSHPAESLAMLRNWITPEER
jgi:flagellar M-ring protein FliF